MLISEFVFVWWGTKVPWIQFLSLVFWSVWPVVEQGFSNQVEELGPGNEEGRKY